VPRATPKSGPSSPICRCCGCAVFFFRRPLT
jgi:hypothetical protein